MKLKSLYSGLCSPAKLYLVISGISLLILFLDNVKNPTQFSVGTYSAPLENKGGVFVGNILAVLFWTWLLNKFCTMGWTPLSWLLVLLPLMVNAVLLGLLMFTLIR